MVKDNEKKYKINKTWRVTFHYDEHKNVKNIKPFIQEIVCQIRNHTEELKLSHYDAGRLLSGNDSSFNE